MKHRLILGLLLASFIAVLAACGGGTTPSGGGTTPSGSQEVQVTLSEYKITSSMTTFSTGTPYHFVVTNTGKAAHEFMIMPSGMNMQNMSMDEMHHAALFMFDTVAPGETKTFDFTFNQSMMSNQSMMGQNFEFACHLPGHYEAGMRLPVTINR